MGKLLNKWGIWVVNHKLKTLVLWLIMFLILVFSFLTLGSNLNSNLKISGLPSTDIQKTLEKEFKQDSDAGQMKIVIKGTKPDAVLQSELQNDIISTVNSIQKKDTLVKSVVNPYLSKTISADKSTVYIDVTFKKHASSVSETDVNYIKKKFSKINSMKGVEVAYSGSVTVTKEAIKGLSELVGIAIAFVLLLVLFRSFISAGLPIISAIMGLAAGLMIIFIGSNFLDIADVAQSLSIMIGLAVGIDYALFILNRYKVALNETDSSDKAMGIALASAGSSVIFAGITVIIAVLGLSFVGIDFLTQMGMASAMVVALAVISSLTLLPSLIAISKRHIKASKKPNVQKSTKENFVTKSILNHPLIVVISSLVVLLLIAVPSLHMRLGMPYNGSLPEQRTERKAYDIISDKFGEGMNAQLISVVKLDNDKKIEQNQTSVNKISEKISNMKNVSLVAPAQYSPDSKYAILVIIPKGGPADKSTEMLATNIQKYAKTIKHDTKMSLTLTGTNAVNIDISKKLNNAIPIFASIVIILAFILLMFVFQSFIIPTTAMLGFGLSLMASLGFVTYVIQDGFLKKLFGISIETPVLAFLPVILIGVLFGLAMDYEVFLVSRVREEYLKIGDTNEALKVGMRESGPVIVTAGLIMVAVFGSFIFTDDPTIKSIGLALTFGVLFDAFVVRLLFIPATIKLFGKANWIFPRSSIRK